MQGSYSYLGIIPVDNEQWHAKIGNFNGCLHYAIIKLKISQVLALTVANTGFFQIQSTF